MITAAHKASSTASKGLGATHRSSRSWVSWPLFIPVLLFLFALAARIIGIDWHGVHSDEHPAAAAKVLTGQFVDDLQYYPPLLNYCTALLFAVYFVIGKIAHFWTTTDEFRAAFFADRTPFYVLLRMVTATWAALTAPLVYFLALRLGQSRLAAVIAGIAAAIIPASIYFSHIGKSDNGLASAFLLVCLAALRFIDRPEEQGRRIALGASIAFAFSVKHSALFLLGPAAVLVLLELIRNGVRGWALARALAVAGVAAVVLWIPMNIGIILDPAGFIDAQVVQSQMSSRDASWGSTLSLFVEMVTSEGGIPAATLILWIVAPLAIAMIDDRAKRFRFWLLWLPTTVAFVVIASIAGDRQPIYLWLPHMVLLSTTVILLLTQALSQKAAWMRWPAMAALAAILVSYGIRNENILQQAAASPILLEVGEEITRTVKPSEKILTTTSLAQFLALSSEGGDIDRARHERLAKKYNVQLPPVAPESKRQKSTGYITASFPLVIGGLETTDPDKVKVVLPYAWPLQPEEWRLDYWLERGFRVFVVSNESELAQVPGYRAMFASIRSQCKPTARFFSKRPLFSEFDTVIYRC